LESLVIEARGRQLRVLRELRQVLHQGPAASSEDLVVPLRRALAELHRWEQETAAVRRAWQESGTLPGPALDSILGEVRTCLEELGGHVQAAEASAVRDLEGMRTELDHVARGAMARKAYRNAAV
jgi:hypothetical protein